MVLLLKNIHERFIAKAMLNKYFCVRFEKAHSLRQISIISLLFSLLVAGFSCSTELEVNAPYRETKVLYSILDPTLPFQTVRISKGFLSDGRSALDIAKNSPDSSLYTSGVLLVELIEKKDTVFVVKNQSTGSFESIDSVVVKRRWVCKDTVYTGKPEGVFYSPDQLVFKTPNLLLDTTNFTTVKYTIKVTNKATGNISEAITNLPARNFRIIEPSSDIPSDPVSFNFRSKADSKIRVSKPTNVEIAQITISWRIRVIRNSAGIVDTVFEDWFMNSPGIAPIQGLEAQGFFGRGQFWPFVQNEVTSRGNANVVSRKFMTGRMDVYGGNKEYDNYRTVNGNYNVITQSLPIYTNVSNGLGIVCSRNLRSFPVKVSNSSLDTLNVRVPDFKLVK